MTCLQQHNSHGKFGDVPPVLLSASDALATVICFWRHEECPCTMGRVVEALLFGLTAVPGNC